MYYLCYYPRNLQIFYLYNLLIPTCPTCTVHVYRNKKKYTFYNSFLVSCNINIAQQHIYHLQKHPTRYILLKFGWVGGWVGWWVGGWIGGWMGGWVVAG